MSERLSNLFLVGTGETIGYKSHKSRGPELNLPERERSGHSQSLQYQFAEVWKQVKIEDDERNAVALPTKQGTYLEFRSAINFDLVTKSLENIKAGIRLLNVRTEGLENIQQTIATVFIPFGKENYFIKKLQDYAQKNTIYGKPQYASLVNSIEDIKLAVLESFWQDKPEFIPADEAVWCEIWLREETEDVESEFRGVSKELEIELQEGALHFPERIIVLAKVNSTQLKNIIEYSSNIAEFRRAHETTRFFMNLGNNEQADWARDLIERTEFSEDSNVAICILDTGVNNGNLLISPILEDEDCQAYDSTWGIHDHNGHGTLMSGLAGYGDIQRVLESSSRVIVSHKLESVKLLPPRIM